MTSIAFNTPYKQQLDFFKSKLNLPTKQWTDIMRSSHDHAFMVAGAMQADLVADFRTAVQKAIEQGTGLEAFRKDFDNIVAKYGWSYNGSRDWRSRVIYRTNMATSYAAGRYAQLKNSSDIFPYWRYVHNESVLTPRPLHQAWDGLILQHNDVWWNTHYPPNGWGCRCSVQGISADRLAKYGKTAPDQAPNTGTNGIDFGWDYAPGRSSWQTVQPIVGKAESLMQKAPDVARLYVQKLMQGEAFSTWYGNIATEVERLRPTVEGMQQADAINTYINAMGNNGKFPVAVLSQKIREELDTTAYVVNFSTYTIIKQLHKRADFFGISEYQFLQAVLDTPIDVVRNGDYHVIYFKDYDGGYIQAVVKVTADKKELYLQSMFKMSAQKYASNKKKRGA